MVERWLESVFTVEQQSATSSKSGSSCIMKSGVVVMGRASNQSAGQARGIVNPGPSPTHPHCDRLRRE